MTNGGRLLQWRALNNRVKPWCVDFSGVLDSAVRLSGAIGLCREWSSSATGLCRGLAADRAGPRFPHSEKSPGIRSLFCVRRWSLIAARPRHNPMARQGTARCGQTLGQDAKRARPRHEPMARHGTVSGGPTLGQNAERVRPRHDPMARQGTARCGQTLGQDVKCARPRHDPVARQGTARGGTQRIAGVSVVPDCPRKPHKRRNAERSKQTRVLCEAGLRREGSPEGRRQWLERTVRGHAGTRST